MKTLEIRKLVSDLVECNRNFKKAREGVGVTYQVGDRSGNLWFIPMESTVCIEVSEIPEFMGDELSITISEKEFTSYNQISKAIVSFLENDLPLVIKNSEITNKINFEKLLSKSFKYVFQGIGELWVSNVGTIRPDGKSRFISLISVSDFLLDIKSTEDLDISIIVDLITGNMTVGTILSTKSFKRYICSGYPIIDETEVLTNIADGDISDELLYDISTEFYRKINKYYPQFIWIHLYRDKIKNPIFFKPLHGLAKIEETVSIKSDKGRVHKIIVPSDKREGILVINHTQGLCRFRMFDRPTNYIIRSTSRKRINKFFSDTIINITGEVSKVMSRVENIRENLSNEYSRIVIETVERDVVTSEIKAEIFAVFTLGWDMNIGIHVEIKQNDPTVRCSLEFKDKEFKNIIYTNNRELISPILLINEDMSSDLFDSIIERF